MSTDFLFLESESPNIGDSLSRAHWNDVLGKVVKITFSFKGEPFSSVGLITDRRTVSTTFGAVLNKSRVNVRYCQHGGIEAAGQVARDPVCLSANIYPDYLPSVGKIELSREALINKDFVVINHCKKDWSFGRFSLVNVIPQMALTELDLDCPDGITGAPVFSHEQKLIGLIIGRIPFTKYYLAAPWGVHFRDRVESL